MRSASIGLLVTMWMAGAGIGCRSMNTVERENPIGVPDPVADKRIETDSGLRDIARVVSVRQATTPDGLLLIQVQVMNKRFSAERFNYMFEWFDQNGMAVRTPLSEWRAQQIGGKEVIALIATAPDATAKDFRLKLIDAK